MPWGPLDRQSGRLIELSATPEASDLPENRVLTKWPPAPVVGAMAGVSGCGDVFKNKFLYTQSKSKPSKPQRRQTSMMLLANCHAFSVDASTVEKISHVADPWPKHCHGEQLQSLKFTDQNHLMHVTLVNATVLQALFHRAHGVSEVVHIELFKARP